MAFTKTGIGTSLGNVKVGSLEPKTAETTPVADGVSTGIDKLPATDKITLVQPK